MTTPIDNLRRHIVGVVIDNVYGGAIEDDDVVYETVDVVLREMAAAPQPKPSRILAGWDMLPTDMKSLGKELIDAAEVMSGGEPDCDLVLSVVPEGGFVDDDGVSNTHPILLVLCVDAEQEGGYPIDPWDTAPQPECVERENGLRSHLESLLELIDVPEANCSCHVAPPCGDCVEHGAMREAVVAARIALEELDAPGALDDDELPGMWSHSDLMGGAADTQNDCAEKSPEALRTAALELADAMENQAEMPLHKWAVKCLFLVNRVRRAAGVAPAQEAP